MQFPFFSKKSYHFLYTLLISTKSVGACIWHVENGRILVDGISDLVLWNEEQEDSLYHAADTAIGSLGDVQANQVLLALPDDWVQGQGIHPHRKGILRALTERLELSSVGFVVSIEAVIAHLKETSKQPLNTVCASIEPDAFIMAVVTQSSSSPILRIGRSDSSSDDFLEGCSRLKAQHVPPQMVLYSLCESEQTLAQLKHDLETHQWDHSIFVQPPTIRLESPAFVLSAVTTAGGQEVLKAMPELSEAALEPSPIAPDFTPVTVPEENADEEQEELDVHTDDLQSIDTSIGRKKYILIGIVSCIILGLLGLYFIVIPKLLHAKVIIHRKSTSLSGTATLVISDESQPSSASSTLRGALFPLTAESESQVSTTGQKKTGDSANGTVTVFNLTTAVKSFKAGTALKYGKINFETNDDITVASASTGTNYEKIPGKASVKVKATTLGEEGNIAKNVELSIGGFDTTAFVARTNDAFTGGASKMVPAVAAKDQEQAVGAATSALQQKIQDNLQQKIAEGQDGFILGDMTIASKKFSKSVGEEASSLTVTMSASASALVYTRLNAIEAAAVSLNTTIPAGAKLDENALTLERKEVKKLNGKSAEVTVDVSGKLTLPVDAGKYASLLAGKNLADAKAFLNSQQAVDTYTLSLSPAIFTPFARTLPMDQTKIDIQIEE